MQDMDAPLPCGDSRSLVAVQEAGTAATSTNGMGNEGPQTDGKMLRKASGRQEYEAPRNPSSAHLFQTVPSCRAFPPYSPTRKS